MKYQLVLQWPNSSLEDFDSLICIEDQLIDQLTESHEVDGHDAGTGEMNIFIITSNFESAFEEVRTILQGDDLWADIRIGYREVDGHEYSALWPPELRTFHIT